MKKVIVIVGPTGSGKTGLSIKLAKALNTEIINGDSVQIYKGLNIGSAKIKEEEKQGVIHHLLDIREPQDAYTVFNFQNDVRKLIHTIPLPMIVGGTGLYIKAALYDYEFIEHVHSQHFDKLFEFKTNEDIYQSLIELDSKIQIDVNNRRRLLRALEQSLLGVKRSSKTKKDDLLYDALIIYLDLDRNVQEERLKTRLNLQIEQGFIQEVLDLKQRGIHMNAIGYRELDQFLDGTLTLDEAKELIVKASKRLAKRQKTWFINQMHPIVLDALSPSLYEDTQNMILSFMKEEL